MTGKSLGGSFLSFFLFSLSLGAEEVVRKESFLKKYVLDGGSTMLLILLAILILLALCTYQFLVLRKSVFVPKEFKEGLWQFLSSCRLQSAIRFCEQSLEEGGKENVLARVFSAGLKKVDGTDVDHLGKSALESAVENELAIEQSRRMFWVRQISLVAQVAPMLGLLGTVIGIVNAFATLSVTGQADPSQLSGDISIALLTTMWGLITAIFALMAYSFFSQRLSRYLQMVEDTVLEGFDIFEEKVKGEGRFAKIPEGIQE